jgi:hypothetical protein
LGVIVLLLAGLFAAAAQEKCAPCHDEQIADFKTHKHVTVGKFECGICPGPSDKHRASTGVVPPDRVAAGPQTPDLCGNCHLREKQQFTTSLHGALLRAANPDKKAPSCTSCHGHHAPVAWKAIEAGCAKCHTKLSEQCSKKPLAAVPARVSCMGCHAWHTLQASAQ